MSLVKGSWEINNNIEKVENIFLKVSCCLDVQDREFVLVINSPCQKVGTQSLFVFII